MPLIRGEPKHEFLVAKRFLQTGTAKDRLCNIFPDHIMKAYRDSGGIAPLILNLGVK
jgi:hypothetical protein